MCRLWECHACQSGTELSARIKEFEKSAIEDSEQLSSIEQFAEQISGYAGITELNFKIIN